jgi:hypothetical protein
MTEMSPYYFRTPSLCVGCFGKLSAVGQSAVTAVFPLPLWEAAPQTATGDATFRYSGWRVAWGVITTAAMVGLLIFVALSPATTGSLLTRAFVVLIALSPIYHFARFFRDPKEIEFTGDLVSVKYWGRSGTRSWRASDLQVAKPNLPVDAFETNRIVQTRSGAKAFSIWRELSGYRTVVTRLGGQAGKST